jgi:uncharacterized membrane protein YsdA (DUF1294 family)
MPDLLLPSPAIPVLALLVVWNLATLMAFAIDKRAAIQGQRRVPEKRLVRMIVFFGAFGAYAGQRFFRHKTKKAPFTWLVPVMALIQTAVLVFLFAGQASEFLAVATSGGI